MAPPEPLSASDQPSRLRNGRSCRVRVRNEGHQRATYGVIGRDPAGVVRFKGQRGRLYLDPGQQASIELVVSARERPLFGAARTLPFEIVVNTPAGQRHSLPGLLEVQPWLSAWMIPILVVLLLLLLAAVALRLGPLSGDADQTGQGSPPAATPELTAEISSADLPDDQDSGTRDAVETQELVRPQPGAGTPPGLPEADEPATLPPGQDSAGETISRRPFHGRVGWAYVAYPEIELVQMRADMQRMRDHGANIVYIGHANPGEPDAAAEPGLTFSVYYAIKHQTPLASQAQEVKEAVERAVQAASEVGLDVVLPIGYQFQMGREWNAANESHLRRNPDGSLMNHWDSGPTASPYSPQFQREIREYFEWVDQQFVRPNSHIVALNLGDEPMGADYSLWAQEAFTQRYGRAFWDGDVAYERGEFLSQVLADAATLLAGYWQEINPEVWVMMTFHVERTAPWFPDFEAVFARTPDNFVFSADTHYHDGLPTKPPDDISLLGGMVRTLGWYSSVYDKPLMLWTSANNWGLRGTTFGTDEALENYRIVFDEGRRNGGRLSMIMVWGYNIRHQGIYRLEGAEIGFDPEEMLVLISMLFQSTAEALEYSQAFSPSHVLLLSERELYEAIGDQYPSHFSERYVDLTAHVELLGQQNAVVLITGEASKRAIEAGAVEIALYP